MERADIKMAIDIVDQFDEPQADHVAYVLIGCGNEITRLRQQVATLTEQRDEMLGVFNIVISEMEQRNVISNGNAPGHAHSVPGVWDSDNGALAGKKCAWCATWAKAKEISAAIQSSEVTK